MKVERIADINKAPSKNISFKRNFINKYEEDDYNDTINQALDYLGVVNRALIIHAPSFPLDNYSETDFKIGTPYNSKSFIDFAKLHGFNQIQIGPMGMLNQGDTSPYTSSVFLKNPLFIDYTQLTQKKYASILDWEDLEEKNSLQEDRVDYSKAQQISDELLETAYNNFIIKLNKENEDALNLNDEFNKFIKQQGKILDWYAVLNHIAQENGTDYYPYWEKEDRDLIPLVQKGDKDAIARYNQIKKTYGYEIDLFKFKQFLINKQSIDYKDNGTISLISDLEVGTSSLDEIVFKDAFLSDYKIGCKYGGPFNSPQVWGSPLINPDRLFNPDGSLDTAGQFLKTKLEKAMRESKNIRIDHVMGLVNPFIYDPSTVRWASKKNENSEEISYVIRDELDCGYLSEINPRWAKNYQRILHDIVLPTMRENGINPDDVVWEDLGHDETGVFYKIFKEQEHLSGISGLIWTKGKDAPANNWSYIGGHDNKPVQMMIKDREVQSDEPWNADYLASYLRCDPLKENERNELRRQIKSSPNELAKAKYADLFRSSKNIQVSFMDFFGINKRYNTPGTTGGDNWTLRVGPDYEKSYYTNLIDNNWAMNMPEILKKAVQSKFDEDVSQNHKPYWQTLEKMTPLMDKLGHYEEVLKEPEGEDAEYLT